MRQQVRWWIASPFFVLLVYGVSLAAGGEGGKVGGELKKWHKVTIDFSGPYTSETATPNPFSDYRLDVTFQSGESTYVVPGYFAADGNAANTSAASGNVWRVHFCPDKTGRWTYRASFKKGTNVAARGGGASAGHCDGATGSFEIQPTDKTGRDHRGKGRLEYVGRRYLRFAETGEHFLKCGADAPENFLAYEDFDNTPNNKGFRKSWSPHVRDWHQGDPAWQNGKGKGIIGAINYLARVEGMNAFSFLTMNIEGDDRNVFPYVGDDRDGSGHYTRFDCSKLDQWEVVFEHADTLGLYLHFKTQETENEMLLDDGDTGNQRRLYYRELIARFSHHLALNWNLGEENGALGSSNQSTAQRKAMAQYFWDHDPYRHNIVIHNGKSFDDLLGDQSRLTGVSVQTNRPDFGRVHGAVLDWVRKSHAAGKPWVVACDEPGDATHALVTDEEDPTHDNARVNALWGTLMAGGSGIEWYFGYQHPHSDLTCEDYRSRDQMWDQCRYALEFFTKYDVPYWEASCDDDLTANPDDFCLSKPGEAYVIYLKRGGSATLDLSDTSGIFEVQWYDPRHGGSLRNGSVRAIHGGSTRLLGNAPEDPDKDWVVLVRPADPNRDYPPGVKSPSTVPGSQEQVGAMNGSVGTGRTVEIDVTPLVIGNQTYTVVLTLDPGGNDIWFGSSNSTRKPELVVTANDPN
ncbi:MAG: DUF5060 domain-containing protein [Planctomycetota bacterium]|jgi:hypothetical protein